jgi:glycosyltransferase involved in cell wall biosynthesis
MPNRDVKPLFSVVVSTYNRVQIIRRCVASCLAQEFDRFEVVVVDDGSGDDTVASLQQIADPRLRVLAHAENRGMMAARQTGVEGARGTWILVLDSDWELVPGALSRLAELVDALPAGVRVLWYRLVWDDGRVSPSFVPDGVVDYRRRLQWVEAEGGFDAGRCVHRDVFQRTPYPADRLGASDPLYELELAKNERAVYVEDVLGRQHFDAANSVLRSTDRSDLTPRLLGEAPDVLWMAQTALSRHGDALKELAPSLYRAMAGLASRYAFLLGHRRQGLRYAWSGLRVHSRDATLWASVLLGMLGPRTLLSGMITQRRLNRRRVTLPSPPTRGASGALPE